MTRRLAAVLAAGLAAACGPPQPGAAPAAAVTADNGVEAFVSGEIERRQVPGGAVVVMRGPEPVLSRGWGMADLEQPEPVTATTVFQLGSISKQFLAALVVRLAEQGLLAIDDPVTRHLPAFGHLPPGLLVRHLLNHTSGIREPFTLPEYGAGIEDLSRSAGEFVEILKRAPVDFAPGERWSYSNANYQLLALIVEQVTGKPYERALADVFFVPLGLLSLRHCTPAPQGPGEARGHVIRDGTVAAAAPENMNWIRGDGGVCGDAGDVARWTRLLAQGRVVSPESYRLMTAPTPFGGGREADYGFGLSLVTLDGRRKVAHNGAMLGFSASAAFYPEDDLTVVVLANLGDVRTEVIERGIARRMLGLGVPEFAAEALPPDAKGRFAGTYDIGVFPVQVGERDGRLWLQMPPPGPTTPLRYLGNGEFVSDSDPDGHRVVFAQGSGPAREVRLFMGAMHWYGVRVRE